MKHLDLLRHAKSSWGEPGSDDFDRVLSERGRDGADLVGKHLESSTPRIDRVLCSSAARTRETLARLGSELVADADVTFVDELYLASVGQIAAIIEGCAASTGRLLVIGHNPGIGELMLWLARDTPGEALDRIERKVPTAALARFELDAETWRGARRAPARLTEFVTPKLLA